MKTLALLESQLNIAEPIAIASAFAQYFFAIPNSNSSTLTFSVSALLSRPALPFYCSMPGSVTSLVMPCLLHC
jgi:hypothetical protein